MIDLFIANIIESIVPDDASLIDVGGGRHPYARADYVIDRRSIDERVGRIATVGQERPARFSSTTWIKQDFYELPWPFRDNQFDFSVCGHTLEDLRDPISVAKEIQRISKAGYISTPTRALESCPFIENRPHLEYGSAGFFHHRWFVEIENNALIFKPKTHFINSKKNLRIENYGQHTLNFFWNGEFDVREESFRSPINAVEDFRIFKTRHQEFLAQLTRKTNDLELYNYWDDSLGPSPNFSQAISNDRVSRLRYFLQTVRNKYFK